MKRFCDILTFAAFVAAPTIVGFALHASAVDQALHVGPRIKTGENTFVTFVYADRVEFRSEDGIYSTSVSRTDEGYMSRSGICSPRLGCYILYIPSRPWEIEVYKRAKAII